MLDLSIIIVSWNTREVLRECLRSVFAGLHGLTAEVIVVDNASSDGSAQMVRQCFGNATLIANETNRGFAAANNQALRIANGKYVLLLNSDTLVLGDVFARSIRYMEGKADVGVMGCRVLNPDRSVQRTCLRYPSVLNLFLSATGLARLRWPRFCGREHILDWSRDGERDVDVVSGCYLLVRASAIRAVGIMDESFFFCGEESDWCRRFAAAGWRCRFAPVGDIVHYGNVSGSRLRWKRDALLTDGVLRFIRKHDGALSANLGFSLIMLFWVTRVVVWGILSLMPHSRADSARYRARHFFSLLQNQLAFRRVPQAE